MKRLLLGAALVLGVAAPATAWQQTFRFATLGGCYVTVGAPDVHVVVSVPPGWSTTGTTTFTTDCV